MEYLVEKEFCQLQRFRIMFNYFCNMQISRQFVDCKYLAFETKREFLFQTILHKFKFIVSHFHVNNGRNCVERTAFKIPALQQWKTILDCAYSKRCLKGKHLCTFWFHFIARSSFQFQKFNNPYFYTSWEIYLQVFRPQRILNFWKVFSCCHYPSVSIFHLQ